MEQRTIGNTDLVYSSIGFGTWEMSTTRYGDIDVDEASGAVNVAIDHGITLFERKHFLKELRVGERLAELAGGYGKSLHPLAIAWTLGHSAISVVLVGMRERERYLRISP
jgi:aryl-alcohol dehydrogenase-like predicted oxidoreductase